MRFGSPGYVAPERLEGDEGPTGDVYSLGVVAYELVSGRPLGRPIRKDRARDHVASALATLAAPEEVRALIGAMLAWDPGARPAAREVEARCRALIAASDGPFLRDWAERAIPPLLEAGEVVTEGVSGARATPEGRPAVDHLADLGLLLVVIGCALGTVGVVCAGGVVGSVLFGG
jgi:serine/threonine protein kinase